MSRTISRLVLAASVAAGFGLAPMVALAAGQERGIDVFDMPRGFETTADTPHKILIDKGDTVIWHIQEGTHTITPADASKWDGDDESGSGEIEAGNDYAITFNRLGKLAYYCKLHGANDKGTVSGMSGLIEVRDPNAVTTTTTPPTQTTQPPATQPPATTPTTARPVTPTTSAPASATGTHTPSSAGPAPTTTTAAKGDKNDKNKKQKDDPTTTTTAVPAPPPPVDIPDSAIIPALPSDQTASTEVQEGAIGEAPSDTPEGQAVALLKPNKRGGNGVKLLIASGLGLGALGLGTAGYKFANRSSKYFPA